MKNALNECHRVSFLQQVQKDYPEILTWTASYCFHCRCSTGRSSGTFLVSLVLANLLDNIGDVPGIITQLWYLDDGTLLV